MEVKLVGLTQYVGDYFGNKEIDTEQLYTGIARVSSDRDTTDRVEDISKLIKYCVDNGHWSIFTMVNAVIYVKCPLYVAVQILRHKSMDFQMFSMRYQEIKDIEELDLELRIKGKTNRQSSEKSFDNNEYNAKVKQKMQEVFDLYKELLKEGVSAETARKILPIGIQTELFINGNLRSWIHYLEQRTSKHAQKEHRLLANKIKDILSDKFSITFNKLKH